MFEYETCAPANDQSILGVATHRFAGGLVLSARNDVTGYWSKAIGFGFSEPITGDLVDKVIDLFRAENNRNASLAFAPEVLPADWAEMVAARGLRPGPRIVKLAARIQDLRAGSTNLRIAPVSENDAEAWAEVVLTGFNEPIAGYRGMFAATARHPRFHPYAVWDGHRLVGGGNLFVDGSVGALVAGSVLPGARGQGGQTGLIAARADKARELGCEWLVTECFEPPEGQRNSSLDNMLRAGFRPLYVRQNFHIGDFDQEA